MMQAMANALENSSRSCCRNGPPAKTISPSVRCNSSEMPRMRLFASVI